MDLFTIGIRLTNAIQLLKKFSLNVINQKIIQNIYILSSSQSDIENSVTFTCTVPTVVILPRLKMFF